MASITRSQTVNLVCTLSFLAIALFSAVPACNGDQILTPPATTSPVPAGESESRVNPQEENVAGFGPVDRLARKLRLSMNCFPADALVTTTLDGQTKLLKELGVGDEVVVLDVTTGHLKVEQVLSNDLQGADVMAEHVSIHTASGHVITATPNHQIFASPSDKRDMVSASLTFAQTAKIVPAADVQVGDVIWVNAPSANGASLSPLPVTSISRGTKRGMLNPVTTSGTLFINGVLVTTFTNQGAEFMPVELSQAF